MPSTLNVGKPSKTRGTWSVKYEKVTAAQTFKVGDWVYKDSAGTLAIASADDTDVGNVLVFGRALANAADILALPSDRNFCPVNVPEADGEFLTQIYHSTAASAILAQADMDLPPTYPLRQQDGLWVANKETDGATRDHLVITELEAGQVYSEQYTRCWARLATTDKLYDSGT